MAQDDSGTSTRRGIHWRRALLPAAVLVVSLFVVAPVAGTLGGKLSSVIENDQAAFLPDSAESTRSLELETRFAGAQDIPALIVWERPGGLTDDDLRRGRRGGRPHRRRSTASPGRPSPPIPSEDGQAVQVVVPLPGRQLGVRDAARHRRGRHRGRRGRGAAELRHRPGRAVRRLRRGVRGHRRQAAVHDRRRHPGHPAAHLPQPGVRPGAHRRPGSPSSWRRPSSTCWPRRGVLTVDGQSQGILSVLVLGASTDYALLLISRFKEELHREDSWTVAMRAALRGAVPADRRLRRHRHPRPALPAALRPQQQQVARPGRRHRHRLRRRCP